MDIVTTGQDLYIMNMVHKIEENFKEIQYLEYYSFNSYDTKAQKVLGPDLSEFTDEFIPEFLNLNTLKDNNGNVYPEIYVDILS